MTEYAAQDWLLSEEQLSPVAGNAGEVFDDAAWYPGVATNSYSYEGAERYPEQDRGLFEPILGRLWSMDGSLGSDFIEIPSSIYGVVPNQIAPPSGTNIGAAYVVDVLDLANSEYADALLWTLPSGGGASSYKYIMRARIPARGEYETWVVDNAPNTSPPSGGTPYKTVVIGISLVES